MSLAVRSNIADLNLLHAQEEGMPFDTALEMCEFAAGLAPDNAASYLAGIKLYQEHERMHEAGPWIDRALRLHPRDVELLKARVRAYELEGQPDLALPLWERVVALDPESDPLGERTANIYLTMGRLDEAVQRFGKIVATILSEGRVDSDARVVFQQYGDALLRSGDANGFLHFTNIIDSPHGAYFDVPGIPWWAGHDVRGKRLFITHQLGYGDQFLMLALVPFLREQGCEVFVTADPAVCELLSPVLGSQYVQACIRPFVRASPAPPELLAFRDRAQAELQATLYHLPVLAQKCGARPQDLFVPYIAAPDHTTRSLRGDFEKIRADAAGRTIVGVAWDCIQRSFLQEHGTDAACYARDRSVPTSYIAELTDDPEIAKDFYFVSLVHPAHYPYFPEALPKNMEHALHLKQQFSETAALIEFCDFTISIDTSLANLSCVQGQETWMLLHHRVDWRYGLVGDRSPWLPTAKLFRQRVPGDWQGVMDKVRVALRARAKQPTLSCITGTIDSVKGVTYASGS
jgi:tetratricopeptide (TPR) repeat protein